MFRNEPVHLSELEYVDTATFLSLTEQQGVVGPMAAFLERFAPQHILVDLLLQRRQSIALRNLWLKEELDLISESLNKTGLGYLVLKGIPLIERLYSSLAERPCADIDLLFRFADFSKVVHKLKDLGYAPTIVNCASLQNLAESGEGIEFSSSSGVTLDVHFDVPSYFQFAPLAGLSGFDCGKEDLNDINLFSLLCDHGSKHMWHRIVWLLDLSLLLHSSKELDAAKLSQHFSKHGHKNVLRFTLGLLADYAILPPAYLSVLDKPYLERQRRYIVARQFRIISVPEIFPRNLWLHLAIIEGFSQKISYIIARTFHPNAEDFKGMEKSNLYRLPYLGSRLVNLIVYRISRFFGPIGKWLLFTDTTHNSSRAKSS